MKSRDYWQKRAEQIAERQHKKADEYIEKLKREYEKALKSIQRDIEVFYQRFAINNEISFAEAKKLLTEGELEEFRMTLEEFIEKAKDNADGRWTKILDNVYFKTRVSRLEALQIQIRQQIELLKASEQQKTKELLSDVYEDTYYRTIFELQKGVGIGSTFAKVDNKALENVLSQPWQGSNFSARIWDDRDKLLRELETALSQAFIRGDSIDRITQALAKRMSVSYSNAARIIRTETSFIVGQATFEGYKASGVVKKYEYLATLDSRTSQICRSMDGLVFNLNEKEVGVNYPPLHPNCRSTVVPYFDEEIDVGERIARDSEGDTYYVPADIKYEVWYDEYVRANQTISEIYQSVVQKEPKITDDVITAFHIAGAEPAGLEYRLKSFDSFKRKVNTDYTAQKQSGKRMTKKEIARGINDIVRYTAIAEGDRLVQVYFDVVEALKKMGYSFVKVKNTWNDAFNPYKGVNAVFHSPNGPNFEIQFHTPESFDMKQNKIHILYEEYRLDTTKPSRKRELLQKMLEMSKGLKKPRDIDKIK